MPLNHLRQPPADGTYPTGKPTTIRNPGLLTASYVLCNAHDRSGNIKVGYGMNVTFWADVSFGSAPTDSVEIKPVFCADEVSVDEDFTGNILDEKHVGDDIYIANLASTSASGWLTLTTATASTFEKWMVNSYINIHSGTNFTPGRYQITAVGSDTSVTLDRACGSGGNASVGEGGVSFEFQEGTQSSASGTTTVFPNVYQLTAANISGGGADATDGGRIMWTVPTPAASIMRVYAKATDAGSTFTASSLWLGVTVMPPGGV